MMINSGFIEKIIMKGMMEDKQFLILISQVFEKEYFDNTTIGEVFELSKKYVETYNKIPSKDVILNSIEDTKDVKSLFEEANNMTFDVVKDYDFLLENTNNHLKDQAMKRAIVDSVDIIDKNGNKGEIRSKIESALCKDIKVDLGLKYFGDLGDRLKRIFNTTSTKVPTYFPSLDEMISGGFPPLTLSILASKIHGFKCVNGKTLITIKNKVSNEIINTQIEDFYKTFDTLYKCSCKKNKKQEDKEMLNLQGMIKKYGEKEGTERYNKWKENVGKASKNRNTKEYFIKKYGEKEGIKRRETYINKQKKSHSLEGYIEKYGEEEGKNSLDPKILMEKFNEHSS